MCGIIGYYQGTDNWETARTRVMTALHKQKIRGEDSFGMVISNPCGVGEADNKMIRLRTLKLKELGRSDIWKDVKKGAFILAHNRAATSTIVHEELTHPFINEDGKIALVHNGVISTHMEKYAKYKDKHKFESLHWEGDYFVVNKKRYETKKEENINDSELLLHHYEEFGADDEYFYMGSSACCIIDLNKDKLLAIKDVNPLVYEKLGDGSVLFSSETGSITMKSKEIISVDREGKLVIEKEGTGFYMGTYYGRDIHSTTYFDYDDDCKEGCRITRFENGKEVESPAEKARKARKDMEMDNKRLDELAAELGKDVRSLEEEVTDELIEKSVLSMDNDTGLGAGYCLNCGQPSDELRMVGDIYMCPDCIIDMSQERMELNRYERCFY